MMFLPLLCISLFQISATEVHTTTPYFFSNSNGKLRENLIVVLFALLTIKVISNADLKTDCEESAATILQLATYNIKKISGNQQNRPFVTIAYAQTLDGSMYECFEIYRCYCLLLDNSRTLLN